LLGLGRLQRLPCDDRSHPYRQKPKGLSTLLARLLVLLVLLVLPPLVPLLFLVLLHD
jgi:hypothetical protein